MRTKTAPAARPDYTIKQEGARFKVYDKESRYRVSFPTHSGAEEWIAGQREAAHRHPFALPAGRMI